MRFQKILTALVLMLALSLPQLAIAAPNQKEIEQYKSMLAKQAELDTRNVSAQDRAMAEKWLKEAEVLLANGEEETAARRLQRVEFALDLIRAMVAASEIRTAAEQQEAEAYKGPERLTEMKTEVEKLKRRKESLQRELQTLR